MHDAAAIGDELGADDGKRNHRELDSGCHGETGEDREGKLPATRGFGDEAHAGVDGRQHERVGERIGEHARGVHAVRHRDRNRRDGDAEPLWQGQTPAEQKGGNRRERDEGRV